MLLASTFLDALFRADFVTALRCPLGAIGFLAICLGVLGVVFFAKESAVMKFLVYFMLTAGVVLLFQEIKQPSSGLTAPPAYTISPPVRVEQPPTQ
jgi:hypothetical protein